MEQKLYFPAKEDAALFVWVKKDRAAFRLLPERDAALPTLTLRSDAGESPRRVDFSTDITLPAGVYTLTLSPNSEKTPLIFTVSADTGAYPFLLNGPGLWHANFLENSLHFLSGKVDLFVAVPKSEIDFTMSFYSVPRPSLPRVYRPDGSEYRPLWLPEKAVWYEFDVPKTEQTGYWHIEIESERQTFRATAWNGYAMFFEEPDEMLPYAYFTPVCDDKIDYRVTIWRGNHRDVVIDRLYSENFAVPYLKGDLRLEFNAGPRYTAMNLPMPKGDETTVKVAFQRTIEIPHGWWFGDCHFHSGYEDACSTPNIITKAARCNGADFIFLADHGGKMILDGGLLSHAEEGRFYPYPAQECMNKRCHMNFLNVPFDIDDKNQDENHWLRDAEKKNPAGNRYIAMLNHPDAQMGPEGAGPYFRSWWVATEHRDVALVENISNYRVLFDMWNRGHSLPLLYTTDTHDGTSYRPASRGIYLYTGDARDGNSTVDALRAGCFMATNSPAVFMTYTVNGKMPGTHFDLNKEDTFEVEVTLRMTGHQVKEIAVIRNENPVATFFPEDKPVQSFRVTVTKEEILRYRYAACWLSVVGYGEKTPESRPNKYIAYAKGVFTYANPVHFDGAEPEY